MSSHRLLRALGLSRNDRLVVLHADDIGMCEATVTAYREILARGILSSASAMVPCGWFPSVAHTCRSSPANDMGVHLTLTSEWASYRWGPLLGIEASHLCDEAGYLSSSSVHVQRPAARDIVYAELEAQIRRAQKLGVDITHLDSHMFTLLHPTLCSVYVQLSRQFRVPCVILPLGKPSLLDGVDPARREDLLEFDAWAELPLDRSGARLETAKRLLGGLPSGVSYFISHPAVDCPELRAIAPDWEARCADYELYLDDAWAAAIEQSGVKVIGMKAVRDVLFGDHHSADRPPAACL